MAVIKCKMCGGELNLVEGASTAECEYCGSVQTIPNLDDEKKLIQFERAERLRKQCEFDKAAGIYENIVADFRQEAEAYWGLVLCKYGIEYVDDPATGKKIPTCHRSSFDSIMEDSDFEQVLENADGMARRVYREEAKAIEELRKGIIAVSANEQPYDIFICYKETAEDGDRTLDSVLAQDVYDALTDKGYRVFFSRISLEDKLGVEYEPYIFAALNSAKIMLAFGTDYEYFNAVWVKNEWSRFLKLMAKDKEKHLIPCYKGIDAYDMPKEFGKLQAQDLGKVGAIQDLLRGISKILSPQISASVVTQTVTNTTSAMVMRGQFALDDGDWAKANEYFERALDENPQDSKAYVGKVLTALHLSSLEQLSEQFVKLEDDKDFERAIRFATGAEKVQLESIREQANKKWLVKRLTNELNKLAKKKVTQEVLDEINTHVSSATVEGYEAAAKLCADARMCGLGDMFTLEMVDAYSRQANIFRILSANPVEFTVAQILNSKYFSGVWSTYVLTQDLNKMIADGSVERGVLPKTYCVAGYREKIVAMNNEKEYAIAVKTMTSAGTPKAYFEAANLFARLGDYLDSVEKAKECQQTGQRMKDEMEAWEKEQQRERAYQDLRHNVTSSNYLPYLQVALTELENMGEYKDCVELARQCREKVARITAEKKEREQMEAHKKVQQEQWRAAGLCQHCGGKLKGLFSKKCAVCGKDKDY